MLSLPKMRDDPEFNIALVQEIEKYPFLYDPTNEDYPNRDMNNQAWKDISAATGEAVVDLKARWRNLRNRHFKVKTDLLSGSKRKSYYLSSHLQFLDCLDDLRTEETTAYAEIRTVGEDIGTLQAESHEGAAHAVKVQSTAEDAEGNSYFDEALDEFFSYDENVRVNSRPKIRAKRSNGQKHQVEISSNGLKLDVENSTERSNRSILEDHDFAFLYSIGADMRLMKTGTKRKFKLQLLKLVNEVLNNQ